MNTATQPAIRPAAPLGRGFPTVVCIKCGDPNAVVRVSLTDVEDFHCDGCGEDFCADDVRQFVSGWQRVLSWLDLADPITQ